MRMMKAGCVVAMYTDKRLTVSCDGGCHWSTLCT